MLRPPPAVRESMEDAREVRGVDDCPQCIAEHLARARRTTREILRALRALRRQEVALIGRIGVK